MTEEKNLEGLSGWLILVGIGIIISPVRILFLLISTYSEVFSSSVWETITTPGSEAYHPLWAPILWSELVINSELVACWVFIAFLFFTKRKLFTKWYIGILLFTLVLIPLDAFLIHWIRPDIEAFDTETTGEFARTMLACLIWIPYMFISKRVKATFVH